MVIGLALLIIIFVIGGVVTLVSLDVVGRPFREWYGAIKGWQQLTGAVLGFTGAAGVFVLGTALQAETARQQTLRTQYAIGKGLALEAERLAQGLNAGRMMAATIPTDDPPEAARLCRLFMAEFDRYLPPATPVYNAVLGNLADFGDQNLTWFVRFHGVYGEIRRAVEKFNGNPDVCTLVGAGADVGYVASLISAALYSYEEIATAYDMVTIAGIDDAMERKAVPPAAPPADTSTAPSVTLPEAPESATASAAN